MSMSLSSSRRRYRAKILFTAGTAVAAFPAFAAAAVDSWTGTASSGSQTSWSNAGNWTGGVPGANSDPDIISNESPAYIVNYDYTGTAVNVGTLAISLNAGGSLTNTLNIAADTLTANDILLGNGGGSSTNGTIIQAGGNVNPGFLILGNGANDHGFYTLSSSGTLTGNANPLLVGNSGAGVFNQSGGTNKLSGSSDLVLGNNAGSTGTYTLGNSGVLTASGLADDAISEIVGDSGVGIFNQTGGQNNVTAGLLLISNNSGSTGTYYLSGTGLLSAPIEDLGYLGGSGLINQSGGTNTLSDYLTVGFFGTGTYTLSNGTLNVTSDERVGLSGPGYFTQTGGINTANGDLDLAIDSSTTGEYLLEGGTFNVGGNANIGGQTSGAGGTGYLLVSGAGKLNVTGTLTSFNTNDTINLDGGTINTPAINLNGNPSILTWTSGTLGLTEGVKFDPSAAATSTSAAFGSSLNLQSDQALNVTGDETLGGGSAFSLTLGGFPGFYAASNTVSGNLTVQVGSTYTIQNVADENPSLTVHGQEIIGYSGNGTFTQSGGTNTASGGLVLADEIGVTGTYTLSGTGSQLFSTGTEILGEYGDAIFNQSGGTNTVTGGDSVLYVGYGAGATGTYTLSGNGTVVADQELIGVIGPGAVGFFTQKGGTNTGEMYINLGFDAGSTGTYTMSGGTLGVVVVSMLSSGTYNQNGGAATIGQFIGSGTVSILGGKTTLSNQTTDLFTPNTTSTLASLTVSSGGILDITTSRVIINYGSPGADPVAGIKAALTSGAAYNGSEAVWTGDGITSSTAAASITDPSDFGSKIYVVGYLDGNNATDKLYGTVGANQIIIKYTIAGDAFLENSVGFHDLLIVAQDYQLTGKDYAEGNFYYNSTGSVGFADLLAVAQSYGESFNLSGATDGGGNTLPLAWQSQPSVSAVPEPGTIGILGVSSLLLARRRKSRHF